MTAKGRRQSALFVFVTVALDAMGIGIIIPVMPDLMVELSGGTVGEAARWGGFLAFTYAVMQFAFSPVVGALSDRFGRRPVLLISLATMSLDYVVMALAPTLWVLFVGRAMSGISGATFSTAAAYIADVTPREKRAAAFGLIGAGFGVGFVFGPAIGGLAGEYGTRLPFLAAAALAAANFAYGALVLPESLKPENRRPFAWRRANPLGALKQVGRLPMVGWLLAVIFVYSLAHYVYPAVWSYYAKAAFGWSNLGIGLSLAAVGIGFALVQGLAIRPILARLGEVRTAYLGLGVSMLGLFGLAAATQGWMVYAFLPLTVLGDVTKPAVTGLMTNRTPDNAQGELQGVISSVQALTSIVSPILMTQLFAAFTTGETWFPGAPFVAAAVFMGLGILLFRRGVRAPA